MTPEEAPKPRVDVTLTREEILDLLAAVVASSQLAPSFNGRPLASKLGDALRRVEGR